MRRIFALFRKDVRRLWPQIAGVSVLMAFSALVDPTYTSTATPYYDMLPGVALPLACWLLVVSVIHQEKLAGVRQYWVTRPYAWQELLASKVLFVAAFINLPLLACHLLVYAAVGIPIGDHLRALLWRQFFFTALYILPAAALAAVTRSLGRVLLVALAAAAGVSVAGAIYMYLARRALLQLQDANPATTLIRAALLAVGVVIVLALQYARRRTAIASCLLVATGLAVVGPPRYGFAFGGPAPAAAAQLAVDPDPGRHSSMQTAGDPDIRVFDIPVRVIGAAAGTAFDQPYLNLRLDVPGKPHGMRFPRGQLHGLSAGRAWLSFSTDRVLLDQVADSPVGLSGALDLQLYEDVAILPLPNGQSVTAPSIGVCRDSKEREGGIAFRCLSPSPRAVLLVGTPGERVNWIVTPGLRERFLPTASGFQPLTRFTSVVSYRDWAQVGDAKLISGRPLSTVRITLGLFPIELRKYLAGRTN